MLHTVVVRRRALLSALLALVLILLMAGAHGAAAATRPANGKIAFTCGANLCSVDGLGHHRRQLTHGGGHGSTQYIEPSLSANGKQMVFQGPDSQAYTADGNGRHMHALTDGSLPTMQPEISADGKHVAWLTTFLLEVGNELTMHLENFDGSHETQYSMGGTVIGFAPHGKFFCDVQPNQLRVDVSPNTTTTDNCPGIVADDSADANAQFGDRPHYSPDGRLIVDSISDDQDAHSLGIFLYNPATGRRTRQLTHGNDFDPVFSPDGKHVLFDRGHDIYEVATHGGAARRLIRNGAFPTWSR